MRIILLILLICIIFSGCSSTGLWPKIKNNAEIDLEKDLKANPCMDDGKGRNCALLTIQELNELIDGTGNFNRGTAYTALALGAAAGSVLTFGGGGDALKGLAIAAGSLLGLNATVNTSTQAAIYEKALSDTMCLVKTYDAILEAKIKVCGSSVGIADKDADASNCNIQTVPMHSVTELTKKISLASTEMFGNINQSLLTLMAIQKVASINNTNAAVNSAHMSADKQLSLGVMAVRTEVRLKLAGMLANSAESILTNQKDRIVSMTAAIIKERETLRKQKNNPSNPFSILLQDVNPKETDEAINNTSGITAVARECTPPATQRAIEGAEM